MNQNYFSKKNWQAMFTRMIRSGDLKDLSLESNPVHRLEIPAKYDRIFLYQRGLNKINIVNVLRTDGFIKPDVHINWSTNPFFNRSHLRFNKAIRLDIKFDILEENWNSFTR